MTARLVGLWHNRSGSFYDLRSGGSFYNLRADGTWGWDTDRQAATTEPENTGKWYVKGTVFHIQDVGGVDPCDSAEIGTYQVSFDEQALVLTLLQDTCTERAKQTVGSFSLVKP